MPSPDFHSNKEATGLGLGQWSGWHQQLVHERTTRLGTPTPKEVVEPPPDCHLPTMTLTLTACPPLQLLLSL